MTQATFGAEELQLAIGGSKLALPQHLMRARDGAGIKHVVRVQHEDEGSAGIKECAVARGRRALVAPVAQQQHPLKPLGMGRKPSLGDGKRIVVTRGIVHDNQLEGLMNLCLDGIETGIDELGVVVEADRDRDRMNRRNRPSHLPEHHIRGEGESPGPDPLVTRTGHGAPCASRKSRSGAALSAAPASRASRVLVFRRIRSASAWPSGERSNHSSRLGIWRMLSSR